MRCSHVSTRLSTFECATSCAVGVFWGAGIKGVLRGGLRGDFFIAGGGLYLWKPWFLKMILGFLLAGVRRKSEAACEDEAVVRFI